MNFAVCVDAAEEVEGGTVHRPKNIGHEAFR